MAASHGPRLVNCNSHPPYLWVQTAPSHIQTLVSPLGPSPLCSCIATSPSLPLPFSPDYLFSSRLRSPDGSIKPYRKAYPSISSG